MLDTNEVFTSKYGNFIIKTYIKSSEVWIRFLTTGFIYKTTAGAIRKRLVKDYSLPIVYGVGYNTLGGRVDRKDKVQKLAKDRWLEMLRRCYCPKFKLDNPTYNGCIVCNEWLDFKNFYAWFLTKYNVSKVDFALDKDLWEIGNKVYDPEHCFLIPQELNNLLIYSTVVNPKTGIELSRNKQRFMPYCSSGSNVRVRLPITDSFEDAVNAYREFKLGVVVEILHKHKHNIEKRLFDKLINFRYEVYIGNR